MLHYISEDLRALNLNETPIRGACYVELATVLRDLRWAMVHSVDMNHSQDWWNAVARSMELDSTSPQWERSIEASLKLMAVESAEPTQQKESCENLSASLDDNGSFD